MRSYVKYLSVLAGRQSHHSSSLKDALQRILQKKDEIVAIERQSADKKRLMDGIEKSQARLRENMKALKGSSEERSLTERYNMRQLNSQEDQMAALSKEKDDLDAKQEKGRAGIRRHGASQWR